MSDNFFLPLSTAGIIRFNCTNVCKNNTQWDSLKIVSKKFCLNEIIHLSMQF